MRLRKKPWITKAMQELVDDYVLLQGMEQFKGRWQELFPGRRLCLEIGCGKGRFITGMAQLHPERAFIGVESQHDIAYYPSRLAKDLQLENVKIICAHAELLEEWFAPGELKELYLNFSDPWPKARHAKRRLTHRNFWALYQRLLGKGGHVRFKTDNKGLFAFTLEELRALDLHIKALSYDLHNSGLQNEVETEYEQRFSSLGKPINFCEVVF